MRVHDALKFKRDLVEETTKHRSQFTALMIASFMHETTSGLSLGEIGDLEQQSLKTIVKDVAFPRLKDTEVIYVGDDVIEEFLGRALGPDPIQFGTNFPYVNDGLVVFEHPITLDPHNILGEQGDEAKPEDQWNEHVANVMPITAISWSTGSVPVRQAGTIAHQPGVVVLLWSSGTDIRQKFMEFSGKDIGESMYHTYPLSYASSAYGGWFIPETGLVHPDEDPSAGVYFDGIDAASAAPSTAVCLVHTLWAMLEEEVFVSSRFDPSKKYLKMMKRADLKDTGVSIITLRHANYVGYDSDGHRLIDWQHRWHVRGHYRRIIDRKTGEERLVWVRAHLKGPQDKPVREVEHIYALTR
jgi:hypothetical protein